MLTYGVKERKGFLAVLGERGAGKTTLIRTWVKGLDPGTHKVILLYDPPGSFERLLEALAPAFGLAVEDAGEPVGLVKPLYQALTHEHDQGKNVVLAVDEAQELNEETLENLRLISNLETPSEKIIQIILVGEPLLWEKLSRHGLRQLKTRITMKINLPPFNPQESREYIRLRLEEAGGRIEPLFTKGALKTIIHQARGNPGRINFLCSQALRTGEDPHPKPLSKKTVNEVIRKLEGGQSASWRRWAVPALAGDSGRGGAFRFGPVCLTLGAGAGSLPADHYPAGALPTVGARKKEGIGAPGFALAGRDHPGRENPDSGRFPHPRFRSEGKNALRKEKGPRKRKKNGLKEKEAQGGQPDRQKRRQLLSAGIWSLWEL